MIISSSTSSSCKRVTFTVDSSGNCRTGGGKKGVCKEIQHLILEQQEYTKYHRGKTVWRGNCPYILAACSTGQVIWQLMSPSSTLKLDELVKHPLLDKPAQCFCLKALEMVRVSLNPLQTPSPALQRLVVRPSSMSVDWIHNPPSLRGLFWGADDTKKFNLTRTLSLCSERSFYHSRQCVSASAGNCLLATHLCSNVTLI